MKPLILSLVALFSGLLSLGKAAEPTHQLSLEKAADPGDWATRYNPILLEGRFAAYMGPSPLVLSANLRSQMPKTYLEAIQFFGPAFIHNHSGVGFWEWYFDDGKALRCSGPYGKSLSAAFDSTLVESGILKLEIKK